MCRHTPIFHGLSGNLSSKFWIITWTQQSTRRHHSSSNISESGHVSAESLRLRHFALERRILEEFFCAKIAFFLLVGEEGFQHFHRQCEVHMRLKSDIFYIYIRNKFCRTFSAILSCQYFCTFFYKNLLRSWEEKCSKPSTRSCPVCSQSSKRSKHWSSCRGGNVGNGHIGMRDRNIPPLFPVAIFTKGLS